ncbi:MAG: hypothetical protein ACI3YI_10035 [Bacteroidaceae bacterium]
MQDVVMGICGIWIHGMSHYVALPLAVMILVQFATLRNGKFLIDMKKEDKKLLFDDLCAILPYHVKCKIWLEDGTTEEGLLDLEHNYGNVLQDAFYYNKIKDIKPYLRPMSSMTEEEAVEYCDLQAMFLLSSQYPVTDGHAIFDWLNKKMFDYRGLIPKDLAIEVTEENNPYKN